MPFGRLSPLMTTILAAYAAMSVATFIAYGVDKSSARGGRRRIPEQTLHLLALLGGWPGALAAMGVFRHKRRKTSFVVVVWLIALLHATGWLWTLMRPM
jgi:uncharacterized membrane protein YsdA (DUF1294 family)